jgi:hypothetical protein
VNVDSKRETCKLEGELRELSLFVLLEFDLLKSVKVLRLDKCYLKLFFLRSKLLFVGVCIERSLSEADTIINIIKFINN